MGELHVEVMAGLHAATKDLHVRLREWSIADKQLERHCGVTMNGGGLCGDLKDDHGISRLTGIDEYTHAFVSITRRFAP